MPLLRNTTPMGDVYLPLLGQYLGRGEVFEVTDEEASLLLPQTANYEQVDNAASWTPRPAPCRGEWPAPAWWTNTDGWTLLVLRCDACHKVAGRFIVPVSRFPIAPFTPAEAIARGSWVAVVPPGEVLASPNRIKRTSRNRVPDPCLHTWGDFPSPDTDEPMRAALRRALSRDTPPPRALVFNATPHMWHPWGRGDGATRLAARPPA